MPTHLPLHLRLAPDPTPAVKHDVSHAAPISRFENDARKAQIPQFLIVLRGQPPYKHAPRLGIVPATPALLPKKLFLGYESIHGQTHTVSNRDLHAVPQAVVQVAADLHGFHGD